LQLEDTVRAIHQAERERQRRLAERWRLRRPVAELDAILVELEELHLRGWIKVPAAMITRIEAFLASLAPDCRAEFPLRTTIVRVMDNLYAVQDRLLSRKDRRREAIMLQDLDLGLGVESAEDGSPAA
jgi:hypothetical protein